MKVAVGFLVAVFLTVVAAKVAYEVAVHSEVEPASRPWAYDSMQFVAWNGERWTAWVRDGMFEQRPQNRERWSPHANVSLAFVDWQGVPWQAKIEGDAFRLARRGAWGSSVEHSASIRYVDWDGRRQQRTVAQLRR